MAYELYIILFGIVLIVSLAALAVVRKSQRETNKMRLQKMLHEERMKAMEKGLEIPGEASRDWRRRVSLADLVISTWW